jgi:hypothetical protein
MPPPPPRKPAPPARAPAAPAAPAKLVAAPAAKPPAKPLSNAPTNPARPKREAFIGNNSATMMTDETFDEFEARMKASDEEDEHTPPPEEPEAAADEPQEDEADDAPAPPQKKGPRGKPLDQFGVEWDYVTHEGMGFNDGDDEDAMTFKKNGKTFFKPDWGRLNPKQWVEYWKVNFALEAAMANDDDDEYAAALKQQGFRNRNHWKRVQATFLKHYADDPEFTNAAMVARQEGTRDAMRKAVKPGALDPIEGVSLQVYASIAAQQQSVQGAAFVKLLAKHKLDEAKFARVAEQWLARMSDQSDPTAAMAIATEYGKAFAGAGVGQFGASAAEASESMGINDKVAGKNAKGGAKSMTFERYVEVMTAQTCWSQQGKDANVMLKKVFNMTAVDWSNASAYWAQKMSTDVQLIRNEFPKLQEKYTKKYMAGVEDPDADLDV